MAKQYLNDEIANVTADTELDGKTLVVETKRFPFPGVNNGNHFYQIKKVEEDYAIYKMVLNSDNTDYEPEQEPVILTSGADIFFYVRRDLAPYMDRKFQQKTVADDEVKEQQLLAAFSAYAMSKYSMGNYNILLTDEISLDAETGTTSTTTTTNTTTSTTTSTAAPTAG